MDKFTLRILNETPSDKHFHRYLGLGVSRRHVDYQVSGSTVEHVHQCVANRVMVFRKYELGAFNDFEEVSHEKFEIILAALASTVDQLLGREFNTHRPTSDR